MNNSERRKRKICNDFAKLNGYKDRFIYDDLLSGDYGKTETFGHELRVTILPQHSIDGKIRFFFFKPVEQKKTGGQPKPANEKRVDVPLRLPLWIKEQLNQIDGTMTGKIEKAVVEYYELKR